ECQRSLPAREAHTPRSVPAYKSPRRAGPARTAFTTSSEGMPATTSVHVTPPSFVRYTCGRRSSSRKRFTAAYATSVSKCEASSNETLLHGVRLAGVTFLHVFPPSWAT